MKKEFEKGVIRSLGVNEAKGFAVEALLSEYIKTLKENQSVRWAIGNAMSVVMTEKELDIVVKIVKDKKTVPPGRCLF